MILEILKGAAAAAVVTIAITLIVAGDSRWGNLLAAAMVVGSFLGWLQWYMRRGPYELRFRSVVLRQWNRLKRAWGGAA